MNNIVYNVDCVAYMHGCKDKQFSLAIVDPPYGNIGGVARIGGTWAGKYTTKIKTWDIAPGREYFNELFRVADKIIVWGGNYFNEFLPSCRNFIVWRKLTISESFTMSMAEYAWTNIQGNAKLFECAPQGGSEKRFHPTQKPIALYKWLLKNYAKDGDKILDTHVGSGSSRIAAYDYGYDFTGCELDEGYWKAQEARFAKHIQQQSLFQPKEIRPEPELFKGEEI